MNLQWDKGTQNLTQSCKPKNTWNGILQGEFINIFKFTQNLAQSCKPKNN